MLNSGLMTSKTPEWYTPPDLIKDIVDFMGEIDLDPCADPGHAVPAREHWTSRGLARHWVAKRIYVNPPYGREIGAWTEKALQSRRSFLNEIILLVPARTDTKWFQPLLTQTVCFIRGRLHFSGSKQSAPFPSALVYLGFRDHAFTRHFEKWGQCV